MKKAVRIQPNHIRFTKEGFEKLKQEREELLQQRPDAVEHLKRAREMGDLSENGYYKASRQKLNQIDSRLRMVDHAIKYADIMEASAENVVEIGRTVTLQDGKTERVYEIVGDWEADPSAGKLSLLSPIGRAIADKKVGDEVVFESPAGKKLLVIKALK
jgi:transcription elongation factor GreA